MPFFPPITNPSRIKKVPVRGAISGRRKESTLLNNVHRCPTRRVFSGTGLELVRRPATIGYLDLLATVATPLCQRKSARTTPVLLATDHVILTHGQVTWTTPELAPPHLTTTLHHINGRTFQLPTDLACIAALHGGTLVVLVSNSWQSQP
ncbi:hypothetical protein TNCV_931901 [Trichonephila clavipes]|nr:hypothetical protein TNCV_931901 [Trichonephila clavipes]